MLDTAKATEAFSKLPQAAQDAYINAGYSPYQIGSAVLEDSASSGLLGGVKDVYNAGKMAANLVGDKSTTGAVGNLSKVGLLGAGSNIAGGIVQGNAAKEAAQIQADAQLKASQVAADAAKFKPVGVTTRFGQSTFGKDAQGNLTSAGYTLSPEMKAQQDALMTASGGLLSQFQGAQAATAGMLPSSQQAMQIGQQQMTAGQGMLGQADQLRPDIASLLATTRPIGQAGQQALGLGTAGMNLSQSLMQQAGQMRPTNEAITAASAPLGTAAQRAMALGQGYIGTNPAAQAAKYMAEQQALLATGRERDLSGLQNKLMQQGRLGLATGGTATGMMAANPEMEAYYNAQRQQDLGLAAQATQGGMDYAKFGSSMVGAGGDLLSKMYSTQTDAMNPYKSMLGVGTNMGQYGTGMATSGADLMKSMYGVQNAAYDPYKTALGLGQNQTQFGTSMVGTGSDLLKSMYGTQVAAFNPYQTALGGATTIEGLGQNALQTGMDLGKTATAASANAGGLLANGMTNAAATNAAANAYSPWASALAGAGNYLNSVGQPQQQQGMMYMNPVTGKIEKL
jgi:hypothetical protein